MAACEADSAPLQSFPLGAGTAQELIVGCWQLLERGLTPEQVVALLLQYADAGFRTWDTADIYGPSERIVGAACAAWRARGGAPIAVHTKCVTNDLRPANIRAVLARSREARRRPYARDRRRLGTLAPALIAQRRRTTNAAPWAPPQNLGGAPALVAFHCWEYENGGYVAAAQELQRAAREGLLGDVAVTNMDEPRLRELLDAGVRVVSNQVQFSVLDRRAELNGMMAFAAQRGVRLLTYGSVAGGWLSDRWVGRPEPERADMATASLRMYWRSLQWWGSWALFQELLATMRSVGARHGGASIAAVAVRYVLDTLDEGAGGPGGAVIVGVRSEAHLPDTLSVTRFRLGAADLAEIRRVLDRGQPPLGDCYSRERGYVG